MVQHFSADLTTFFRLLGGTVIYRPYVYGFFVCFLFFALRQLRLKGTLGYLVLSYLIAFSCEYSATRNGFPFGMYVYLDEPRSRELWISNIPFWDSLSFVFLSYFSWMVAAWLRRPEKPEEAWLDRETALLGGFLMMMLDVVIDPLTLLGDRWFLGRIYYYPDGGAYFGVTLSNFAGWFFVGTMTLLLFQTLAKRGAFRHWHALSARDYWGIFGVYAGVLFFQLGVTAWIGEWVLLLASGFITAALLAASLIVIRRKALA